MRRAHTECSNVGIHTNIKALFRYPILAKLETRLPLTKHISHQGAANFFHQALFACKWKVPLSLSCSRCNARVVSIVKERQISERGRLKINYFLISTQRGEIGSRHKTLLLIGAENKLIPQARVRFLFHTSQEGIILAVQTKGESGVDVALLGAGGALQFCALSFKTAWNHRRGYKSIQQTVYTAETLCTKSRIVQKETPFI
jgi:hypothetical protein